VIELQDNILQIEADEVEGMMRLRPYQVECVDCIYEGWREYDALMVVLATGLGKTVIASDVVLRWPESAGRILFIAHVRELIDQAQEKIEFHTTIRPAVEMGSRRGETQKHTMFTECRTVCASIQTMQNRMQQFDPKEFGLIIVDEFHHAGAPSYRKLWEYFKTGNEQIKLLGITATPYRGDNVTLGCIAENCAFEMGIREGIDEGYLVPIQQQYIVVDQLDFTKCRTVAKDLNEGDLEQAMMGGKVDDGMTEAERLDAIEKQERMLHAIAVPTVKESQGRPTLVFCVTVAHAQRMAEVLRRYPGVTAEVVHGGTPEDHRAEILGRFKRGATQMLVGVGCFTEGFDAPNVAVVAMARPTKKQGLYVQMIGRGTRPLPGVVDKYETPEERKEAIGNSLKPHMVVLDFVGNSGKHKLVSTADVLAGDMPPDLVEEAVEEMRRSGEAEDIREVVERKRIEKEEAEKRRRAEFLKRQQERDEEEQKLREQRALQQQQREEARRAKLKAEAEYRATEIDPFGQQQREERVQPKYRGGSSDAQVALLAKLGIPKEAAMAWSKGQAGAVISQRVNLSGGKWYMRFGKYAGKQLKDIPHSYLRYMGQTCQSEDFQKNLVAFREEYRLSLHTEAAE
jgi:superfamily II DNA or RNA helicase